ncbi:MAG: methyltransferase domain-containing protein [Cephaloticoccus sp.]|nr:methyltransferase domain-containing protein [Cephaloticoccus sp.]MCF7761373.1 methyltransferase domain-containing protein [Cephaloticoccus sp.]
MPIEKAQAVEATRRAELQVQLDATLHNWPTTITLEIGCGHGHYLAAYAAAHPEEYCLGIDIIRDRLERAQRKTHRARLANVAFFLTEARMLVENLPEAVRLNRILVLFPDPWPKRRHAKNRLLKSTFLDLLAQKSTPTAKLFFRTDHAPYFEETKALLHEHPDWQLSDEPWPFEHITVFQSRAPDHQSCIATRRKPL